MWELDCEESWAPKNRCFWTVVLEKTPESPLDCKEIQPVHPKGNQSWVFIGRTDAEAETPVLWPPDAKSWLIGKDPDAGKEWGQEEKGMTVDGMVGWHHRLNGHKVWVDSGSWWWTGRPGMLQFMGSQRVGHDWATELNWTEGILTGGPHYRKILNFHTFHMETPITQDKITCDSSPLVPQPPQEWIHYFSVEDKVNWLQELWEQIKVKGYEVSLSGGLRVFTESSFSVWISFMPLFSLCPWI